MEEALAAVEEIDEDSRKRMWNYLKHTAYFLVAGHEMIQERKRLEQIQQEQTQESTPEE
jgi:hypothetical protein